MQTAKKAHIPGQILFMYTKYEDGCCKIPFEAESWLFPLVN